MKDESVHSVSAFGKNIAEATEIIVEFAELEDFMDQKLKNYSSGMQVRLAFSVAIKAQGDILVLDEVLAVGDEAFQRKCDDFFTSIRKDPTKTVVLVTHDMGAIKRYCTRAMFIQDGEVAVIGDREFFLLCVFKCTAKKSIVKYLRRLHSKERLSVGRGVHSAAL